MPPASTQYHVAKRLLANLSELPLWVKQVMYIELYQELMEHFSPESLEGLTTADTIAFYVPKLTETGERMVMDQKGDVGRFLLEVKQQYSVLDMCLMNQWTLETCCILMMDAIDLQWVQTPPSAKALGTFQFLANRIRLGEYLVKMSRISADQLEQALRTQMYIKEALQEHTGIANILINLGYITRQDIEGLLFLKEESQKPFNNVAWFQSLSTEAGKPASNA